MKKRRISIQQIIRFVIQVTSFFLLPGLFAAAFAGIGVTAQAIVNQNASNLLSSLFPTILLIVFTIIFGRIFCGYVCAFGSMEDGLGFLGHSVLKLKTKIPESFDKYLKYLKYIVLLVLFISFFFTPDLLGNFSPWESFSVMFSFPLDYGAAFTTLLPGTIILLVLFLISIFYKRFFCRYLCPLGAIFSLVSRFSIFKVKKERSGCGACHICTNNCPMGIPLYKYDVVNSGECIHCLNCVNVCPRSNPIYTFVLKKSSIYAASIIAVGLVGLYYGGNIAINNSLNSSNITATSSAYADGTYTGSGTGYRGTTKLSVKISNGKITSITTISTGDSSSQYNRAFSTVVNEIISSQSTNVQGVSGCTYSSNGIKEAVADALSQAKTTSTTSTSLETITSTTTTTNSDGSTSTETSSYTVTNITSAMYKDGTYTGSGSGHRGTTKLSIVISEGKITSITTISTGDDSKYYTKAFSTVVSRIISAQSSSVQAVSGATDLSRGIMAAVANALSQAEA
jgi:uncharacterized protein with FMN-binding domain